MQAVLNKWGNSMAIRLPSFAIKKLNLSLNSKVDIEVSDDKIILKKSKLDLGALCDKITSENISIDDSFNDIKGKEW